VGVPSAVQHRRRAIVVVAMASLLAIIVAACGAPEPPEFPDVPEGASVIDQDGLKFIPNQLTVSVGDDVYFTNSEHALHTVTVDGENISGNMSRGDAFVWTFDTPSEYRITCDFHPRMRATIIVE